MPQYQAPLDDYQFLMKDWLAIDAHYQSLNKDEFDMEIASEVIAQGAKFAIDVLAPLNREGDEQGCRLENGEVKTPDGFAAAYKNYVANGWNSMLGSADFGGQDLPYTMAVPVHEMLNATNLGWRLTPLLTESAVLALTKHASEELKEAYLPQLISGEWTGTMNLTEPHAGTDLSLLRTKAVPQGDGSYKITGNKIFITGGEQDWTSNIIHLVLARLPDAPAGVKGISLFVVPKFLLDDNGAPGQRNSLSVGSIEHKMGVKASPTCVMNFDEAKGFLVGQENQGLACMFTMMNDARFQVGLQGIGTADASYRGALSYAQERLQSRAPQGPQQPENKADAIIFQPDVARMLLTQRSMVEGCRALAMLYAKFMDVEKFGDQDRQAEADQILQFLTPICKAFMTDMGLEATNIGVQVFGGHGYIREWGMEQLVRDTRIALLYEGTNGVQAQDLIGRKLTRNGGHYLKATYKAFEDIASAIENEQNKGSALALLNDWLALSESCLDLNAFDAAAVSCDYLAYTGYSLLGVLWYSMSDTASRSENQAFAVSKRKTCEFYISKILPRRDAFKASLLSGSDVLMAVNESSTDYIW